MTTKTLDLADITADVRCQSRTELDDALVAEYAEQITVGTAFPPLMAIQGEEGTYLYDGFHRYYALKRAGRTSAKVDISPGTLRDAVLNSAGANATHGKRRTSADKRRSAETLLNDSEWSKWSDNEISRRCMISPSTVGTIRRSLSNLDSEERAYTDRHGNISTMNTTNIGTRSAAKVLESDRLSDLDYEIVDPITAEPVDVEISQEGLTAPSVSPAAIIPQVSKPLSAIAHAHQQVAKTLEHIDPERASEISRAFAKTHEPGKYGEDIAMSVGFVIRARDTLLWMQDGQRMHEIVHDNPDLQNVLDNGLHVLAQLFAKYRDARGETGTPLRRVS
jgi:hypothetical protein